MKNLTFKAAMLKGSRTTVNRQSTDGQSQRHCKQTPLSKRWKVLMTLVFLFTFGIGQMWAVDPTLSFGTTSATTSTYLGTYETEGITISSDRSYSSGMVQLGSTPSSYNSYYVQVSAGVAIDSIHVLMSGNGSNKNLHAPMFGWETSATSDNADTYSYPAEQTTSGNGYAYSKWFKYDMTGASVKCTRIYRSVKNVSSANPSYTGSSTALGSGQTIQIYGMKIWLHKHTVTLNLNGGSYASTPEGWTVSAGKYTKAVFDGSLALPEPTNSGNTFAGWKNKNNEDVASSITVSKDTVLTAQWTPTGGTQSAITYNNTKGATNSNPDTYYEGTGISSFAALADVDGFHFTGWDPSSIAADATGPKTINAQWVSTYNVTFSAGAGSGTVPTGFQKWEGATFELPGQGSMVAPTGKAFDGWKANGAGDKLAEGYQYTMGTAAVNFVAQWKAVPQTIFHWRANETTTLDETNGTTTGGTVTLKSTGTSAWSTESAGYNSAVASDMKATTSKELKAGGNAYYLALNLSGSEKFKEGDTIYVTGYNPWIFSTTTDFASFDVADSIFTGTSKTDINTGYEIIKDGIDASTIYARRGRGTGTGIAAIKVIRPAARDIASTVISLSDLKVNNRSISSDSLDILKTPEAYALTLGDEFVDAPVIKFNEYTVITYVEGLPATKESNKVYTVTATVNGDGKWQAAQEIAGTTYTVTAPKASSAKVSYYDGATKLGEEVVAIGDAPADYADFQGKDYATFVGWYSNPDLADGHLIADITALTISANTNIYGKWAPAYATSVNIEQWVLDHGTVNNTFRAELTARNYQYTSLNNLDSLNDDPSKPYRNYAYLGQKVNKTDSEISFLLKSGSTLNVRFGHIGTPLNVVIGSAEPVELTSAEYANDAPGDKKYTYAATEDVIVKFQTTGTSTCVFKQIMIDEPIAAVVLPAEVTLNPNGGKYGDKTENTIVKYTGTALVIGDATPDDDDHLFDGWYDGETKINAEAYVPTKNVTLVAHYVAKPSPFSLTALTYQVGTAGAVNVGYVEGTYEYTVKLPYAHSYDAITVAATLKESTSNIKDDAVLTVSAVPGAATFTVTDGVDEQLYTVNFVKDVKDGVEIIGVVTTGGTNKDVSGLYKGDAAVNLDSDKKIGSGKYIYVTLASGYTFEETDVLVVDVKAKSDLPNDPALEITTGVGNIDGSVWKSIANADYELNLVTIPLTGIAANQTSIGLKRSDHQNTWVNGLKVYRAMNPVLTAITINGEDAVKGTGNTFTITLPEEGTDLAALTVVPTIIRNAPHATTPEAVISNEGAWKAGDNTYRVMDKDGDYTDYTITITLQGEAPAPVIATQPAGVAYCAGSEPTLEVVATGDELHYAWFKDDAAIGSDAATCVVDGAGTYKVVVTNHVDGKLDKSVTSENAVVTLSTSASITIQPSDKKKQIEGDNITLSVVAANATGYQWYSCDDKDKTNAVLIAGAESADYQFAATAGFYYCVVTGACNEVESNVAEVTVKRSAGCQYITATSGYETTEGGLYICGTSNSDGLKATSGTVFATASNNAKAIDAEAVGAFNKQYIIFKFPVDVEEFTLYGYSTSTRSINNVRVNDHIGTNSNTDKFTSAMEVEATKTATKVGNDISLTAVMAEPIDHSNYVNVKFNGAIEIYRICYTEALPKPVLPTLSNQEYCAGGSFVAWNAETTVTEGTLSYQWYDADADEAIEGATNSAYTPTANGHYYVKVTNASAGRVSRVTQSSTLSAMIYDAMTITTAPEDVTTQAGVAASLSVEASGNSLSYAWYTCDANGDNAVALDPAVTTAELNVTAQLGVQYYKVVVTDDCDAELSAVAKVEGIATLPLVAINGSYTWDFTKASAAQIKLDGNTAVKKDEEAVMVNIPGVEVDQSKFKSQALKFSGEYIHRTDDGTKYPACATTIKFETTVPGKVTVVFADNGGNNRRLSINGNISEASTGKTDYKTYSAVVPAGEVVLTGYKDNAGGKYIRFFSIDFTAASELNPAEADYTREVSGNYGTICLPNGGVMVGAAIFEIAYMDYQNNKPYKIYFDEVLNGEMVAGMPYIFLPNEAATQLGVFYTDAVNAPAGDNNGLYGSYTKELLAQNAGNYILYNNQYYYVNSDDVFVGENRAYIYLAEVPNFDPGQPAYGRRRVSMNVNAEQTTTDIENLNASEQPVKLLINGQIFILRGEKMFDATGRLVK